MGKPETDDLKKEVEMDEHQIPVADLEARLGTNVQTGLTAAAAKQVRIKSRIPLFFDALCTFS